MKFSPALVSLLLILAGAVDAAHISNLNYLKRHGRQLGRRSGPSATHTGTPSPTTTSAPSAPSPTSSSGGSGNMTSSGAAFSSGIKRGLSFNDASLTHDFTSGQASWCYNWYSSSSGPLPQGVQYVPMLWGADAAHTSVWESDANAALANGAQYILGFNEPDLGAQSNLSPQAAAQAWQTHIEPFAGRAKLVSPAITNGGPPMGTAWLDAFLAACAGCTIDAIAIHIYDAATNIAYYESYIAGVVAKYNKPVWVTEFGATGTDAQVQAFLGEMVQFLDGLPGLAAFAWFTDDVGNLVNADASLTALGNTYVSS
ncbi:hypothetical protein AcV5_003021 [Taiwanofungus camphoratus]|nr:hypothetical protein AcV5_003021 [Antrodia cinnamomea]KAI0954263.1 hypothetical protein AcV7_007541 [Antrodia cinnamomea]